VEAKTEADENKDGMISMHFGDDVSVQVQLHGMDPVNTITSLLGLSPPPNAGAAAGAQIGAAALPRKESGKRAGKRANKDANSGAAAASCNENLSMLDVLVEIVIPLQIGTMNHDTRALLDSSCTTFHASDIQLELRTRARRLFRCSAMLRLALLCGALVPAVHAAW